MNYNNTKIVKYSDVIKAVCEMIQNFFQSSSFRNRDNKIIYFLAAKINKFKLQNYGKDKNSKQKARKYESGKRR